MLSFFLKPIYCRLEIMIGELFTHVVLHVYLRYTKVLNVWHNRHLKEVSFLSFCRHVLVVIID